MRTASFSCETLLGNCHPDWFRGRISRLYLHPYLMKMTKMFHLKETIWMKHRWQARRIPAVEVTSNLSTRSLDKITIYRYIIPRIILIPFLGGTKLSRQGNRVNSSKLELIFFQLANQSAHLYLQYTCKKHTVEIIYLPNLSWWNIDCGYHAQKVQVQDTPVDLHAF